MSVGPSVVLDACLTSWLLAESRGSGKSTPASMNVVAYKKSEHGNEGDTGVLTCKNPSFPPVISWAWYRNGQELIVNGSGRYIVKSSGNKTELRILKLNIEEDTGDYHCNATNSHGSGSAVVNLRVRSRLAALWPFLGIVAEVLVLVTIIFIYEKRRKPDEVLDGKRWNSTSGRLSL
uniref:Basigin n=1 Tax=Otus sunia TaxID=257818 RepID=A0A8C8EB60_9STRI